MSPSRIISVPKIEIVLLGRSYWAHKDVGRFALGLETYSDTHTAQVFLDMCRRYKITLGVFKSGDPDKNEAFTLIDIGVWMDLYVTSGEK